MGEFWLGVLGNLAADTIVGVVVYAYGRWKGLIPKMVRGVNLDDLVLKLGVGFVLVAAIPNLITAIPALIADFR